MNRTQIGLAATIGAAVLTAGVGCRTCDRHASQRGDRDDRYCTTAGHEREGRLAGINGCDPATTSYGQPGMVYTDAPVVGSLPGLGSPFPGRPENELPFPQSNIQPPGVPAAPPVAGFGRSAFEARLPR